MGKIASSNIQQAMEAIKYAEDLAKESPTSMLTHANQFVAACCMQLRLVFSVHFADEKIAFPKHLGEVVRLTKHLLSCLLHIFSKRSVADLVTIVSMQVFYYY